MNFAYYTANIAAVGYDLTFCGLTSITMNPGFVSIAL